MNQNYSIAGMNLPPISHQGKLTGVLKSCLGKQQQVISTNPYWYSEFFGLEKVQIFQDANDQEKAAILSLANYGLLEEAYYIEKAGIGYMAKMVLIAQTTEERMLYALFSADEATHLSQINRFLPQAPIETDNAFLRLLAEVVESEDKAVLLFVLQVILEGWGLTHYKSLAKGCQNPELTAVLQIFLQDEARHHGTGVKLFNQMSLSKESCDAIASILSLFLQMVQVGPQSLVAAIEKVKGHLSSQQKVKIFEELETEKHSGSRLKLLRSLMRGEAAVSIVQQLEEAGAFTPFPPIKCVFY